MLSPKSSVKCKSLWTGFFSNTKDYYFGIKKKVIRSISASLVGALNILVLLPGPVLLTLPLWCASPLHWGV